MLGLALGSLIQAVILCGLVWIVARGTAEINFANMFFLSLGVGIAGMVLSAFLGMFAAIPVILLLGFLLMKYFYLTLGQAVTVIVLYSAVQFGTLYLLT